MNPARSLGSAVPARAWTALWIYFTAPLIGMLLAAELYVRVRGTRKVICAKFHHGSDARCIFACGYRDSHASASGRAGREVRPIALSR